jgi:2-C-methyl-D-erythritol 4-phosphate cytidylyltransferase
MNRVAVIIPAAGKSERVGLKTPKPFLLLAGVPVLARTINLFQKNRRVGLIQPVLPNHQIPLFRRLQKKYHWAKCLPPVRGGRERQDSVANGLAALPAEVEIVMIHDAARPFVTPAIINRVLDAARRHGAALAAVPVHDTVKSSSRTGRVLKTVDRRGLWLAQTPQAFRADLLREAHRRAAANRHRGTDESALIESMGHPVHLVPGSPLNLKITTREDLALARSLARLGFANPAVMRENHGK